MPLYKISGPKAWETLRENRYANWGSRSAANRVEPVAEPAFRVPFTFDPNAAIFTIGSCFARVIEGQLAARGFSVPMFELCDAPEFENLDPSFLNNFGTPSIYYELASAFGEFAFDESALIRQLDDGRYTDMQLIHAVPPASLDRVRARREAIRNAVRMLAECNILIMTLGIAEVWWDEAARIYLNVAPHRELIEREPDRYSLCLLDFAESYAFLEKALDVAFRHGRDDLQMLITVSPVPLLTTFLAADVMVASCYSKSLLRTAAEQAAARFERVTYLPLYETVTLSDRQLAWTGDMRHVSKSMVHFNVSRVLKAFAPGTGESEANSTGWAEPTRDLEEFAAQMSKGGASSSLQMGRLLDHIHNERYEEALELAARIDTEPGRIERARILSRLGRHAEAIEIIEPICRFGRNNEIASWMVWVEAIGGGGSVADLKALETIWQSRRPNLEYARLKSIASALAELGDRKGALDRYARLAGKGPLPPRLARRYVELLLEEGRPDEALAILDKLDRATGPRFPWVSSLREQAQDQTETSDPSTK